MKTSHVWYFNFIFFILLALPINGKAESHADILFYQTVLGNVNKMSTPRTCEALLYEQKSCSHLFNLFEGDRSTGVFFRMISDSAWDTCKKYIPNSKEISINELEKKLSENTQTSLGLRNDFFLSKVESCLPKKYNRKDSDVKAQSKFIVTLGYDYLNRIKKSTALLTEEIKNLNSIVGEPITTGIPCEQFSLPHDVKICQDINSQNCKPKSELGLYTATLFESAIEPLIALKASYKNLSDSFSKTRTLRKPANQEILKDLTNKMKSLESLYPLLKGKSLGPFIANETSGGRIPSKEKLQEVIKTQLLENRENLSKKLNENVDMNNCIAHGEDRYCKDFDENFSRLPAREDVNFFDKDGKNSPSIRIKNIAASEIYGTNQCLDNVRGLKGEFNSFAADFSINVGLTIFTGGTSLLVRAGGQGVKLALAGHKAMLLADAAFLATGAEEAISTCSKELNKIESSTEEKKSTSLNVCPVSLAKPESVVVANYQACVTGAMMASLNALPFVPAAVSKYLSRVKTPKTGGETTASGFGSLLKFKTPKKAFDPHDLRTAGTILPSGKMQDPSTLFKRDGVYVYIIDDKGNMVLSHRTPDLSAGTKEGDQFLGTHRGLFNKLSEKGGDVTIVAAGEIRVVGGVPVKVSTRAGSFHSTPEEVLASMKQLVNADDKMIIDILMKEYGKLSPADRANSMVVEMHMEDFLDSNPGAKAIFENMQKKLTELTDVRLETTRKELEARGLLPKEIETKFVREVAGDAHIEGRAAAVAEIECSKTKSCAEQLDTYQKLARKFLQKYKNASSSEEAIIAKTVIKELEGASTKDKAFAFFNTRISLLLKEGPIEFIRTGKPESYGITEQEALKYLDEWSKQF